MCVVGDGWDGFEVAGSGREGGGQVVEERDRDGAEIGIVAERDLI